MSVRKWMLAIVIAGIARKMDCGRAHARTPGARGSAEGPLGDQQGLPDDGGGVLDLS